MSTLNFAGLVAKTALVAGVGGSYFIASDCETNGCKATASMSGDCAIGRITLTLNINIGAGGHVTHGSCHCPESECVVKSDTCSISETDVIVSVVNAADDIYVGGVNFGDSFTWSPSGVQGCGNQNYSFMSVDGPAGYFVFVVTLGCNSCDYDC